VGEWAKGGTGPWKGELYPVSIGKKKRWFIRRKSSRWATGIIEYARRKRPGSRGKTGKSESGKWGGAERGSRRGV